MGALRLTLVPPRLKTEKENPGCGIRFYCLGGQPPPPFNLYHRAQIMKMSMKTPRYVFSQSPMERRERGIQGAFLDSIPNRLYSQIESLLGVENGRDGIDNRREWQTSSRLPGGGCLPFSRNCGIERSDARRSNE
jgi:hypothetical protein